MNSYDPESGQVFKETIVRAGRYETLHDFLHRSPTTKRGNRRINLSSQRGMKRLQDLCMQSIINHADSLLPETLETLPEPIAIKIWSAIRREGYESFHVWKTFINAGFRERTFRHHLHVSGEVRQRTELFGHLSSHDFAWVVNLTLNDVDMSASELREVSRVRNLQSLQVHYNSRRASNTLDDRIVQVWSQRSATDGSFSRLETLAITNAPGVTIWAFDNLAAFLVLSSLFLYETGVGTGKRDRQRAKRSGWFKDSAYCNAGGEDSLENLKRGYMLSEVAFLSPRGASNCAQDFVDRRLSRQVGPSSKACVLRAQLRSSGAYTTINWPENILCFERDPHSAESKVVNEIIDSAPARKKQKVKNSKAAGFAAMLDGA